jgi:uncharacterized membrane protein YfcA
LHRCYLCCLHDKGIFCIVVIFVAYTIKGLSGFGSGLVAIPLLALIFPLKFIVPVMGLLSYVGTIIQGVTLRKHAVWRDIWPLMPFSILGIGIAVWLLVSVEAKILTMALGVFVLLYAVYSLSPSAEPSGGRRWAIVAGGFGGMVGALFGTGGPFYVLYLKMRGLEKGAFRATIASIFLIDGGVRMVGYASTGLYTNQVMSLLIVLLPVLLLAMYVGNHLHVKIEQKLFNQVISVMLMISGLMLIIKSSNI